MPVTTTSSHIAYDGAGSLGPYAVPFYFLDNAHIQVTRTVGGVESTESGYTLTGAGNPVGGSLTLATVLNSGEQLDILRVVPVDQNTEFVRNDPFPSSAVNGAIDKLTMIAQQTDDTLSRALVLPVSGIGNFDTDGHGITGVAEPSQGDPSGAANVQYVADFISEQPVAGDAVILRADLAANGTGVASGKGMSLLQTPNLFSIIGATMARCDAMIRRGEIHPAALGYATADGATDNLANINAISLDLEAVGGGKLVYDRHDVLGGFYKHTAPIRLRDRVCFEGADKSVLLVNTSSATNDAGVFHGFGLAQQGYGYFDRRPLANIAKDARVVVLTNPADYVNPAFAAGKIVLIFSNDGLDSGTTPITVPAGGTNFVPIFSRQYRIMANDLAGNLTLDEPIDVAVGAGASTPWICDGTGYNTFNSIPSKLVDSPVIRNLRMLASDLSYGKSITGGAYQGLFENIHVDNCRAILNTNAFARCLVRNWTGNFRETFLELASGSHDTVVENVRASFIPGGLGSRQSIVKAGEFIANMRYRRLIVDAQDFVGSAIPVAVNITQTSGLKVSDSRFKVNGIGVKMTDQVMLPVSDVEFTDCTFELSAQTFNFLIDAVAAIGFGQLPTDIRMNNCRFTGANPSTAAIGFRQSCTVDFKHVYAGTGVIQVSGGVVVNGHLHKIEHTGWSGSFADINKIHKTGMIRASGQGAYSASQSLFNTAAASTVANTVVASCALPAGLVITARDQIVTEATAVTSNSSGTQIATVALDDGGGAFLTQIIAAADVGAVKVKMVQTIESNTVISTYGEITYPVGAGYATVSAESRRTALDILTNGRTPTIQGWVANANRVLTFNTIDMRPKLYGDGS